MISDIVLRAAAIFFSISALAIFFWIARQRANRRLKTQLQEGYWRVHRRFFLSALHSDKRGDK